MGTGNTTYWWARMTFNEKPVGVRRRIGYMLISIAQRLDRSRLYAVVDMTSCPELAPTVHRECVTKGLIVAEKLFKHEVREAAGEIALRAAMPDLFKGEKTRG